MAPDRLRGSKSAQVLILAANVGPDLPRQAGVDRRGQTAIIAEEVRAPAEMPQPLGRVQPALMREPTMARVFMPAIHDVREPIPGSYTVWPASTRAQIWGGAGWDTPAISRSQHQGAPASGRHRLP